MKTRIRDSYTPKLGDYCNTLVVDKETGNQYLFDADGVWTLISTDEGGIIEEAVAQANAYTDDVAEGKVDKEEGKGLSENDFTDADKDKLDGVEAGAQENVIEVVKRNGTALPVVDKTVDVEVPTATSALTNDSGYITNTVDDLVNYYDKDDTDTLISTEAETRDAADLDLQEQIDAISSASDVVDVVGTYAELQNYDTSKLGNNDIIKVLTDETHDDAISYYRWNDTTETFTYIGSQGPFYTKSETDATFVPQTRTINGKGLNSDVVLTAADVNALPSSTVIPTVNDATLTIQKNGSTVQTFTANQATNATANIIVPTKTSDLANDGSDNTSTYVESDELAAVATSGSYNDLIDKPTIDFELVEMSYGESNAWAKFIAAYQGHKIVYCRASSNANPATGTQGRKAFMAYVNNADNPTEVEFQYVRSVSSKTASQPVDQVFVYKLTNANGGTWTVETRNMAPKLAQGTNTTVSYSNGTYTVSATQPTVNDATLTIKKNGSSVGTFTANSSTNTDVDITVPTKTSDLTNDSGFIDKNVSDLTNYYTETEVNGMFNALVIPTKTSDLVNDSGFLTSLPIASATTLGGVKIGSGINVAADGTISAAVASLDWANITNKPTDVSYWTNDAGYITSAALPTKTSDLTNDSGFITSASLPTKTSDLTNDSGFITNSVSNLTNYYTKSQTYTQGEVNSLLNAIVVPTKTSDLTNDGSDGTSTYVEADDLAAVATSGSYTDLSDKPTIGNATLTIQRNGTNVQTFTANATSNKTANITVPTKTSDLTNDSNFVSNTDYATAITGGVVKVGGGLEITNGVLSATGGGTADAVEWDNVLNKPSFSTVATSGSYNDLSDKPTIPTVNNATLTIQRNSTSVGTFTANASSNKTINITVPTTAADVSALPASTKYGASITVSLNTTDYKMTTTLKDQDGNTLGTAQTIDLPLESVVVNGSYDNTNKKIVLTLQNGNTVDIPVGDLVAGLQTEITSTNKLASDLVDDTNQTHKFMTSAEKTKLSGIAAGAEVNVQSDWNVTNSSSDAFIKNKPSIPTKTSDLTNDSNFVSDASYVHTDNNYTTAEKNKLAGIAAGAEVNQNAFSNVKVGTTTVAADTKTDTLELVAGSNVTITPDATNDKVTIAATDTTYSDATTSAHGLMSAADKTKLNGIATGAEVNVQANWTQTTTTADDYIKNKPTLATVATSGSYNDLSNKPTIPTVNNATLTIQKNGTNVQTFTANQSTNATANITVPTNNNELTNGAGYITSSGTAAKANQLTTARTIAISGGATGTATSFNGTSNISIPVTDVKDAYVTWGGKNISGNVTPDDMGCIDEFSHNKLAYLPASCIDVAYSTDGGTTWVDYGLTDAQKVKMVTTSGPTMYAGGPTNNATSSNIANLKVRVRIACGPTSGGKLYTAVKKILINISNQGAADSKVDIRSRTIANYVAGTDTWNTVGTYAVSGGSGWNSIPFNNIFGGSYSTQSDHIGQLEFVLYCTALGTWGYKKPDFLDFRMIGATNWAMPSELARAGHLYTIDENQNATFPANVTATKFNGLATSSTYNQYLEGNGRINSADIAHMYTNNDVHQRLDIASGSMSTNKPAGDGYINTYSWDNTGAWDTQLFIPNGNTSSNPSGGRPQIRFKNDGTWTAWEYLPLMSDVPTKTSDLNNDSGFMTSIPTASASTLGGIKVGSGLSISNGVLSTQSTAPDWSDITNKPTFATVATSGSYNDLSNKPTIPTVNNATLTIQKNGTTVKTFTANASSNVTANITVPTTVAELSDSSDYATTTDLATKQNLLSPGNHISIASNVISATGYVHSENPQASAAASSTITGSMIANGTITANKLASDATVKLTMSTSDIGEGAPLAANTLYGVYI